IEDNGVGISEEFQAHMFDAFEREKNTTASGIAGTGLGLTIAKNIINMMGGTIEVFSQVGKGSRFTVTISLRILDKPFAPASGNSPFSFNASGTYKILLVEDNELNLEIETELIKEMGFIVDTAMDGSVAVDKISHSRPGEYSLVLMDIQMPVMDGYEAAKAIRGLKDPILRAIPIIAVSSNAFEEDRRRSRESGMDAHIAKPVDYPELLDLIEKTLHQKRTSDMSVL
ncbi:MAG TPA: hybrid sensor histidine kinase/response regulator, partial [Lachnospiraceae bacterium]|nr:hybrid sensor histidine kinase/response regulator [Lachnospiraceae bacterium]